MRKLLPLLCLLAAPAMAQEVPVETIFSSAGSLNGLWKIQPPQGSKAMNCRIEHVPADPAIHCFERAVSTSLTLRGTKVRIAFYPTLLQTDVFEGELTSPDTIAGSGHILLSGISMLRQEGLEGHRQTVPRDTADLAGKAPLLRSILSELAGGHFRRPYDRSDEGKVQLPRDLKTLGAAGAITYLGLADTNRDRVMLPDFFAVYLVDFANGQRFCGLHATDNGLLDGFRCV